MRHRYLECPYWFRSLCWWPAVPLVANPSHARDRVRWTTVILIWPAIGLSRRVVGHRWLAGPAPAGEPKYRAVGHRKGCKQLLSTRAGLAPTLLRLFATTDRGCRLVQSKELTIIPSSLEPGNSVANAGHFPCHRSCRATNEELCRTRCSENSVPSSSQEGRWCPLYLQLLPNWCGAANWRFVPTGDIEPLALGLRTAGT